MDHFPPPSRPASFRLRHLVRLRSTPNRWPYSRGGLRRRAGCLRLERGRRSGRLGSLDWSFRCAVRRRPSVWQPSLGVGGNCRRTCLRHRSRRLVAAVRPFGDCHGRAGRNMRDLLLQRTSHWTTRRLYVRFGRRYRNRPPTQHLDWWHAALLVLAGGGFSTVVRVAGDTRRPERTAVASAGTAVARFLKSVGGPNEDAARHAAAVSLHDTWTTLVSRQLARSADHGTLTRLRSISRELHRLFVDGINAGGRFADREALAARAHDLAAEARSKAAASTREEPEHLPLGKHGVAEAPRMAISHSGRLAPRRPGGGNSGISGSRTGPGTRLLDRSRRRSHSSPRLGLEPKSSTRFRAHYRHFARPRRSGALARTAGSLARFDACGLAIPHLYAGGAELRLGRHLYHRRGDHNGIRRIRGGKHRRAPLGSSNRHNNRLRDRNRRAAGDGASRVDRSDPARTRRGSGCRSTAAEIRRRRRCGFLRGQTVPAKPATQGDRAPDGVRTRRRGAVQDRRFAEGLWPAVVTAQRVLYRLLAFCWTLEEAGSDGAGNVALAAFGASGQASLNGALEGFPAP
jgi:hypothetical protein